MATKTFDPELLRRHLETDPAGTFRMIADAIDKDEIAVFSPRLQGNGFQQSRYGRVVFNLAISLEVAPVATAVLPKMLGGTDAA